MVRQVATIQAKGIVRAALRATLRTIYPPHCLACNEVVSSEGGLCGSCWREAHFIEGLVCDCCGAPLPGEDHGTRELCDDCLSVARPWSRGRAAMIYRGSGRRLVLGFKHGDRTELARAAAGWMAHAGRAILEPGMLAVPVPLHWRRLYHRKYNQSALLAAALARRAGMETCPDLLRRTRSTGTQEGKGRDARFANVSDAISVHPRRQHRLQGRDVLLVDDVLTSGATLAACAEACLAGGANDVRVMALARVVKDR